MEPASLVRGYGISFWITTPQARAVGVALAMLLFAASTPITLSQHAWDNPYAAPTGLNWFFYPRNPPAGLTSIDADLHAVWALPDNRRVWAGGEVATLVYTDDAGGRWRKMAVVDGNAISGQPEINAPNAPAARPTGARGPAGFSGGSGVIASTGSTSRAGSPSANGGGAVDTTPSATIANPQVTAGKISRLQIETVNFRIDPKVMVTAGNTSYIAVETPEPVSDSLIIVPVSVRPEAPPGAYTLQLHGYRQRGEVSAPVTLSAVFTVSGATNRPTQSPAQTAFPAAGKGAMLFWRLPVVHAAELSQPPAAPVLPPNRITAVRFRDPEHGALTYGSGSTCSTGNIGASWLCSRSGSVLSGNTHSCIGEDLSSVNWAPWPLNCTANGTYFSAARTAIQQATFASPRIAGGIALPALKGAQFSALFMLDLKHGWLATTDHFLFRTTDGNKWDQSSLPTQINALYFQPDGMRGWAVGAAGSILSTEDGGVTWVAHTQDKGAAFHALYSAGPAPWYVVSLVFSSLLLGLALLPSPVAEVAPAIEVIASSDRPLEDERDPDPLSFRPVARSLAYFIRNPRTTPPLNFAVTGPWGSGKTSLMRLLRSELKKHGFRPVWFNAWHHQKEKYLLPSLLDTIRQEAVPKPWNRGGIAFRLRLLRSRWQWWFAILALVFVSSFAITATVLYRGTSNSSAETRTPASTTPKGGTAPQENKSPKESSPFDLTNFLKQFGPHGTVIVSGIALLATFSKWLSAFGVEPAALLTGSGSGARVTDLEKQTSFRYRFAKEFREVTEALGSRQMVVFIDDLDRCQPQNTLEILEAVNFLSSSGDCFVVMGMAKELVEEYVARSLDNVSKALNSARKGTSEESPERLAGEYLQKLINIEVPVPQTGAPQMKTLVESLRAAGGRHQRSGVNTFLDWTRLTALTMIPLLGVAFLGVSGFEAGKWLVGNRTIQSVPPSPKIQTPSAPSGAVANTTPVDQGAGPSATASKPGQTGEVIFPGVRATWRNGWPAFIVFPLMIWALYRVGTWRPDLEPTDSAEFDTAMDNVLPLVISSARTPRSVKRFVNKVRYIAMRVRQRESDDRMLWARLWGQSPANGASSSADMPDYAIVVLAALDYWKPGSLDTDDDLKQAVERWDSLKQYQPAELAAWRARYLKFASGLNVN